MTSTPAEQHAPATAGPRAGRPRVVHVIDSLGWGGAERLLLHYLPFLRDAGFDVRVCALQVRAGNPVAQEIRALGVPVDLVRVDRLRDVSAVPRLVRYLRSVRADLVHTQLEFADALGTLAARRLGIPSVSTLHTMTKVDRQSRAYWRNRIGDQILGRFSRAVICVSDGARNLYLEEGRYPERVLVTLRNGIDLSAYPGDREAGRRVLSAAGVPDGVRVLVSVAVLRPPKGLDVAIAAMPGLISRHPDIRYVIVGDGEHRDALEAAVREHGVGDFVRFLGARTDVADILAASDIFVHPTLEDALPTVLAEAGASSLPAVASRVGGVPEMTIDGRSGFLVPPGDSAALGAALDRLLADPDLAAQMGREGNAVAHARFDLATQAGRLAEMYREWLDGAREPDPGRAPSAPAPAPATQPHRNRMRVFVVEPRDTGGMIHYAYHLCSALAAEGADVTLITGPDYELDEYPHDFQVSRSWRPPAGQRTAVLPPARGPLGRVARKLRRVGRLARATFRLGREWDLLASRLERERPDWVLFGSIEYFLEGPFLIRLNRRGLKLASIVHEPEARDNKRTLMRAIDERAYRRIYAQFSALFVHNRANRERLLELYPDLRRDRIHVIEHGNNLLLPAGGPAEVDLRGRWGIPADAPVVLFFGTMLPSKGIPDLIHAFALTAARHPEARLVVTGHPSKKVDPDEYAHLAQTLGISERVVIEPGYVPLDEVQPLMETATVVAFPYRSATQSGAMQVAYAFARPVVATRVGGLPEVVEEGASGYTVPPQDPKALSDAINRLLDDPEGARRMGEHAKHLSETKHSWGAVAGVVLGAFAGPAAAGEAVEQAPEPVRSV